MTGQLTSRTGDLRSRLDISIEATWLTALALIPLAFNGREVVFFFLQPKDLLLHFAALLIAGLWGFEWALKGYGPQLSLSSFTTTWSWRKNNPRNWALAAAAGFGVTATISTILSPLPGVSLWGRDFSALGYELHSILSLLVIFFAIALRVREPEQVKRILWVIAGAGTLTAAYGVSQRYGWDPIGYGAGSGRVISSFGNPIFFGSYLVMSIVITFGLALERFRNSDRWWLPLMAVMVGIQLTAIWFTGSRGPWLGVAFGMGMFVLLGALFLDRSQITRGASVLVAGLLIAVLLTIMADDPNEGSDRSLNSVISGGTPVLGGAGGRSDIWQGSVRLLDSWERPHEDSRLISAFRPIFGLGPEMFFYSYPLVANPQSGIVVVSHSHNLPLQLFLENGLAGLATFALLAVSVLLAGVSLIKNHRRGVDENGNWLLIVTIALMATLVGRAVEQMVGIARVGDLVPFWALTGVTLAVYGMAARSGSEPEQKSRTGLAYRPLAIVTVLVVVALGTFGLRDAQMLRAGLIAGDATTAESAGDKAKAITLLQRATELAPDVQHYRVNLGELLLVESRRQLSDEVSLDFLEAAYQTFLPYEQREPSAFITQLRIGNAEAEMVKLGDEARLRDLIERAYSVATSMPAYPAVQAIAAQRLLIARQPELGLELANRAIAMEAETSPQTLAWLQRGLALGQQDDVDGALESFLTGLEGSPTGPHAPSLHRSAALAYDALGDPESAAEHRAQAAELVEQHEGLAN